MDISKAFASSLDDTTTGFKRLLKNMKLSSGTTYGELEMLEAAPLIFPALDQIAEAEGSDNAQKSNQFKNSGRFVTDYFDRRAQAKYVSFSTSLVFSPSFPQLPPPQKYLAIHPTIPSCTNIENHSFPSLILIDDALAVRLELIRQVEYGKENLLW